MRRLIGWLLVVFGVLASALTGMMAADAATKSDYLPPAVGAAIFAVITLGCLGGAWLLLRRRHARRQSTHGWDPCPGEGWLPQQAWAELPDVLPRRPRLGPCPPAPSADVPPDGLLRRLWLVRAELAFDQAGGMRTGTFMGWIAMLSLSSSLTLLLGAMLATGEFSVTDWATSGPLLAWAIIGTVVSGERAARNPRRHFTLRRLQRELEAAYAAAPGPIPAGPVVRLGDPTPRYAPAGPPELAQPQQAADVAPSDEAARELVQQTLSREWGEPAVAVHIVAFDPAFRVPGRRADGSSSSHHRVRRFFVLVPRVLWAMVVFAIDVLTTSYPDFSLGKSPSGQVHGSLGSPAVQVADVLRGGEFWLVISTSRAAAVRVGSSPPLTVMWSAEGSQCPQLDRGASSLRWRWPDGSSVNFLLDSAESQRLVSV